MCIALYSATQAYLQLAPVAEYNAIRIGQHSPCPPAQSDTCVDRGNCFLRTLSGNMKTFWFRLCRIR